MSVAAPAEPDDGAPQGDRLDTLFDLNAYDGTRLEELEARTSPGHVASRIAKHEPMKLAAIIRCLREGMSQAHVARAYGISRNTAAAIIHEHMGGMETYLKGLAREFGKAAMQGVHRVQELMDDCTDVAKAAIATGIVADKALAFAGLSAAPLDDAPLDPRVREQWNERLRQMRERRVAGRVVEADTAEALPEKGEQAA